jgi:hypothetical protein
MSNHAPHDQRPEFMATLGLLPPYAIEDVKAAYRDKVKFAHPDRGGSVEAFNEIQTAFERAQAYLEFRGDRRTWIGAKMAHYVELQDAVNRLEKLGAKVTTHSPGWIEHSYGDFAQLIETVELVRLEGPADGDALIRELIASHHALKELQALELPHCSVSDDAALSLARFQQLNRLDLSHTPITSQALDLVDAIESLVEFNFDHTSVGWWARRRANSKLADRRATFPPLLA